MTKEPSGKTDIIRAAVKIFARKGYDATSVDEIAAKAKVAKGTIYYHFKTKPDIFLTIIEQGIATFTNLLISRINAATDPTAQLAEFISAQVDFFLEYKDFCRVLLTEMWRLETHWQKEFQHLRANYSPLAIGILEKGKQQGVFRSTMNPEITATIVFNAVAFTSIEIPLLNPSASTDILKQQLIDSIINGIASTE